MIQTLEGKASILLEQKNYEEALKCFEELLKLNHSNENYILGKAKCLDNLNKKEEVLNIINDIKGIDNLFKKLIIASYKAYF